MIRKRTVFILGAGASCEYGFPLGSQLRNAIIQLARGDHEPRGVSQAVEDAWAFLRIARKQILTYKYHEAKLKAFAASFELTGTYSIDAYLQHREEFRAVGAATIGLIISYCERHDLLFSEPRLYAWLAERMGRTPEALKANPVTFVTFNYDRSFEYFMVRSVQELTNDAVVAHEVIDSLNIIHMHGSLGRLPRHLGENGDYQTVQAFEQYTDEKPSERYSTRDADRWERTLKLVGERVSEEQDAQHQKARNAIAEADVICFLGFGFDQDNMRLLGFPYKSVRNLSFQVTYQGGTAVRPIAIGTAVGLSKSRRREVAHRLLFPSPYARNVEALERLDSSLTCEQLLDDNIQTLDAEWDLPEA